MRNIPWKITEKRNVCKLTTCTCNPFYRTLYGVNHLKYYLELNGGCHISSMIASMCVPSGFIVTFFKVGYYLYFLGEGEQCDAGLESPKALSQYMRWGEWR